MNNRRQMGGNQMGGGNRGGNMQHMQGGGAMSNMQMNMQ